jgi:cytochrome c oxidase subunit 1
MNAFISIAAIITFSAQAIFAWNFFYSIFKGKRAPLNPWNSTTLEWTTPINPEHGNWPGEIPAVYRWPYDYSKPGSDADFIPQNVPFSATKSSNLPEENEDIAKEKDIDGLLGAQNESYNR